MLVSRLEGKVQAESGERDLRDFTEVIRQAKRLTGQMYNSIKKICIHTNWNYINKLTRRLNESSIC